MYKNFRVPHVIIGTTLSVTLRFLLAKLSNLFKTINFCVYSYVTLELSSCYMFDIE